MDAATATEPAYRYWAFISYSHADQAVVQWLHKALEGYRVPAALQGRQADGRERPARLFPVFRDRDELPAAHALGEVLQAALRDARFLVVVCSPASARSPWVDQEIAYFKSLGREDRVLALIIDGEPGASGRPGQEAQECFPPALRQRIGPDARPTGQPAEPVAADMRPGKDGREHALLKLVAGMLGVGFDQLRQRDAEQRRIRRRRLALGIGAVTLGFAGLGVYAYVQQQLTLERGQIAASRQLAAQSRNQLDVDAALPLLLSLEALAARETVEARRSLFEALTHQPRPITLLPAGPDAEWRALAVTPDGRTLVGASATGALVFWGLAPDGRWAAPQVVRTGLATVRAMALSRDGRRLAVSDETGRVALWDPAARAPLARPAVPRQPAAVTALAFGAGDLLALGQRDDAAWESRIVLWRLNAGRADATLKATADGTTSRLVFSRDARLLASSAIGGDTIVWDVAARRIRQSDFMKDTLALDFSADGRRLLAGSHQLIVRDVDSFTPTPLTLPDAPTPVLAVRYSPDGRLFATASHAGNLMLWDAKTLEPVEGPFPLKLDALDDLVFSPDGRTVFVAGQRGRVAALALRERPLRRDLPMSGGGGDFRFDADGHLRVTSGGAAVVTFPAQAASAPQRQPLGVPVAAALALLDGGRQWLLGGVNGVVGAWDRDRRQFIAKPLPVSSAPIDALVVAPDGRTAAVVPRGPEVFQWDVAQAQPTALRLAADPGFVRDAVFSPDGATLYTVGDAGELIAWDWPAGRRRGDPVRVGGSAQALAIHPGGQLIAVGLYTDDDNGTVVLVDLPTGQPVGVPLTAHAGFVRAAAFSPDGKLLATGGDDGRVWLWDVDTREPVAALAHGATVFSGDSTARLPLGVQRLRFHPAGTLLAADGPEDTVVLWDVDLASWKRQACRIAARNFTAREWARHLGQATPRRATCPDLPLEAAARPASAAVR